MTNLDWWREVWTIGEGRTRTYCGIARTPEGYAVDVFRGDICIESESFETRIEAAYAVDIFRRRYATGGFDTPTPVRAAATAPVATYRN